jgi:uncharacterized alpha-E superfamily protein
MLSRVADAIYWMSRYVERAENVARFIDVNLNLMLDSSASDRPSWEPLVLTAGDQAEYAERYGEFGPDAVTHFLTFDRQYANSILSSLTMARENARTVRDIISRDMWQQLNEFYLMVVHAANTRVSAGEMGDFFTRVKMSGIQFEGVTNATLSRGEAWHFAHLGRMLERADKTSRILDVKYFILLPSTEDVGTTLDQLGWNALLNSASALQMYRQQYHTTTPTNVTEFLLLDENFPRSIRYCVTQADMSLQALTRTAHRGPRSAAIRSLGQLRAKLDYTTIQEVMKSGFHEYLDALQLALNETGKELSRQFFHPSS